MELLQGVLVELAVLGLVALAGYAALMLRKFLQAKLTKEQFDFVTRLADAAVWAVEQRGSGIFSNKKQAALGIIEAQLRETNMLGKFPTTTLDAAVEASVAQNFHYTKHTREPGDDE